MKELYCVICSKYKKYENPKRSHLFEKTLVLPLIYSKCKKEEKYLKTKIQLKYKKLFV